MNKKVLIMGSLFGLIAVILGAFAAHGLKNLVDPESISSFQTGVRYQMYHAILLLFVGTSKIISHKTKIALLYLVGFGVLFFSGSIYGLSTNSLSGFDFKSIAFITPVGGLLLVLSWLALLLNFIKLKSD